MIDSTIFKCKQLNYKTRLQKMSDEDITFRIHCPTPKHIPLSSWVIVLINYLQEF